MRIYDNMKPQNNLQRRAFPSIFKQGMADSFPIWSAGNQILQRDAVRIDANRIISGILPHAVLASIGGRRRNT